MTIAARLTVLGSLNMDISVVVPQLPLPGATVLGGAASYAPGGKGANQAVAAARLGAAAGIAVRMVGCVGDDDAGRMLRAALRAEGVDGTAVRTVPGVPSGIAMITVDRSGENTITVAPGANREVGPVETGAVETGAMETGTVETGPVARAAAGGAGDVLVISAEVPVAAIRAALAAARGRMLCVLNLAPAPPEAAALVAARPDWLVVNEPEAAAILGRPVSGLTGAAGSAGSAGTIGAAAAAVRLVAAGARHAVVTAGAAGAAYHGPAGSVTVPGFKVRAVDSVGAGDTFVGALGVALVAGVAPAGAVTAAAAAAAAAVTRPGTQQGMPRPADVLAATAYPWPVPATGSELLAQESEQQVN